MPPSTRDEFEVAIICALPREADAVEAFFDETYDKSNQLYGVQPGDTNVYTNGKLGPHDVVLCCLPGTGKGNAASAASSLRVSYPSVQLALLVGICGAVRFTSDGTPVSLGDVILSDRVVEYDFGRRYPDGFERKKNIKETSSRHTRETRAILADLKTRETSKQFHDRVYQYLSILQTHRDGVWQRPNNEDDTLSDTYTPSMHIGTMGSGDTVVKSADYRNKLATDEEMIGFEMEGAAATGASAAKAFLEHWRPTIRNVMTDSDKQCLGKLRLTDPQIDKIRIEMMKGGLLRESSDWVLQNPVFRQWQSDAAGQLLWIKGDAGKGKTMLIISIIDKLS